MDEYTLLHYLSRNGRDVFNMWLHTLRDTAAKVSIIKRLNRVERGNLGDTKPCRDGVWELRFDNGYRVYYAKATLRILIILCGGTKHSQRVDIERAVLYWRDWQERHEDET